MLLPGDIGLAGLEDVFADAWTGSLAGNAAAWRTTTAIHRLLADASDGWADLTLLDMGSSLGAINRIGLIASDGICIPLPPDPLSLRSLSHLGPVLTRWRTEWAERIRKAPPAMAVPAGAITPLGYIAMQAGFQPPRAHAHTVYRAWMDRLPAAYGAAILAQQAGTAWPPLESDPNCLGQLRHYRSLMALAWEAHKPIFHLTPVDGAIGAFVEAVRDCKEDFRRLATKIANVGGVTFE